MYVTIDTDNDCPIRAVRVLRFAFGDRWQNEPSYLEATFDRVYMWVWELRDRGIDIAASAGVKAKNECEEYIEHPSLEEAADVIIAILGSCCGQGWSIREVTDAVHAKMAVNEQRQWTQLSDGTYQHVEPSDAAE